MNLQQCTEALRTKVGDDCGLNATLRFDCGADGSILIDGKSTPNQVRGAAAGDTAPVDCNCVITLENLTAMLAGELEPANAFMMGKLKVSGDMSVAMRLQRVV
jgi:putative sterol carrier protein